MKGSEATSPGDALAHRLTSNYAILFGTVIGTISIVGIIANTFVIWAVMGDKKVLCC